MTSAGRTEVLVFSGVEKSYALNWQGRRVVALRDFTLRLQPGSFCALVGANGSGKTTALKLAAGLLRPDRGECWVDGLTPTAAAQAGRVAYLPEVAGTPAFDSVREWLVRLAEIGGLTQEQATEAARVALIEVGLETLADRPCRALSKGQRQRLGLAQATLRAARLLLLDEPGSGLDPRALADLAETLRRQRQSGRAVLLTAHASSPLVELCDQIVLLAEGRVLFSGDRAAVDARGGIETLYLELVK